MPASSFRPLFNRGLSIALWAFAAVAVVAVTASAAPGARLAGVASAAAGASMVIWAVLWSPRLVVADDGLHVENVLTVVDIPWAALIHLETRYALTLVTPGGRIRVTAAPAPGQLGALRSGALRRSAVGSVDGTLRSGELPHTDSGRAASLVRARWERLRESGAIPLGVADATPVARRLHRAPAVALVAGTALVVVGVLLV